MFFLHAWQGGEEHLDSATRIQVVTFVHLCENVVEQRYNLPKRRPLTWLLAQARLHRESERQWHTGRQVRETVVQSLLPVARSALIALHASGGRAIPRVRPFRFTAQPTTP